ncbi:MAG: hypothetical protein J7L94_03335 [Caldisericaceae bacterium]|nr:hypothetical protein [Caldisericaceae bacterium]
MKHGLIIALMVLFLGQAVCFADQKDAEKFKDGPKKDWSEQEFNAYNQWINNILAKTMGGTKRQTAIMNGNKITAQIYNYGSISNAGNHITDIVWNGLGYAYEFGPLVGAEVPVLDDKHPDTIVRFENGQKKFYAHVISDGLTSTGPELNPDRTIRWGFQPLVTSDDGTIEYLNPASDYIPTSDAPDEDQDGKPDSWPDDWYNPDLREYVWPGALGQGATNADKEAFYVIDDRDNAEFSYYPFIDDTSRRGLGIQVEVRIYQWSNPLAEDAIFLIYKISNKSDKDLKGVVFGMWGDPHIGGWSDYNDDWAYFDKAYDMVFAYDTDGKSMIPGRVPGYLGYKFLESPGIGNEILDGVYYPGDGIDNDGDGMVDESWTDGIDNDGDWDPEKDDVGIDGIPNTGDLGEGDGQPTAGILFDIKNPGEPNFEFTDIDESDMLGLTGFENPAFGSLYPRDDEKLYSQYMVPNHFDTTLIQGDRIFLYSSGRFKMRGLETKRFSIALLMGEDFNDLVLNAETVQQIYNTGYQFSKPPAKPHLVAVPGDRKVTLYWDNVAESSYDPISEEIDFEGYVIYRSTSPDFADQQVITDINGNKFLFQPLKTITGMDARFDLVNEYQGPSKTPYRGRGVSYYLGNNTGLVHSFVDSNNVINGQTYFYALVSYDHGNDSLQIPPTECSKIITFDPTTNTYKFDVNTVKVIPRCRAAGYVPPEIVNYNQGGGVVPEPGTVATGKFSIKIVDELAVEDNNKFLISFSDSTGEKTYSVEDLKPKEEIFTSFYGQYVSLQYKHLNRENVQVTTVDGLQTFTDSVDYLLDAVNGRILVYDPAEHPGASMQDNMNYKISYTNYPVWHSTALKGELTNPFFDGLQLSIMETPFKLRSENTGWSASSQTNLEYELAPNNAAKEAADYLIKFYNTIVDTSLPLGNLPGIRTNFTITNVDLNKPARYIILESTQRDTMWNPGETIFILVGDEGMEKSWSIKFVEPKNEEYIPPAEGDEFYISVFKPFKVTDRFSFVTKAAHIDPTKAKNELDKIRVVPNPYVATNIIEPKNFVDRGSRGYRRLYFDRLPKKCTIKIFTTAGELVRTLEHDSTIDDGKEYWDLLTKDNIEAAYGLYFYHVSAPGIGEKVGKFVIIK